MLHHLNQKSTALLFLMLSACGIASRCTTPAPLDKAAFDALYYTPAPAPTGPINVYHLGHSLVGTDMPAMLTQLAGTGHNFNSQLGWGTTLKAHWDPDTPITGFDKSNTHSEYRDAHQDVNSGVYDAFILTESVEIRDAIKYSSSDYYLRKWADAAWGKNPTTRIYLYETWHELDDPEGWLERLDRDLDLYWEGEILRRALAYNDITQPIYVIPAGQIMARFVRKVEARGGIGPIHDRTDLFSDNIHLSDYGAYLVALSHYAVLYGRSPIGLPHALKKADGTPAANPGPEAASAMQEVVWEVISTYTPAGVEQL